MDRLVDLVLFATLTCTHDVHISACSMLSICYVLCEHCVVLKLLVQVNVYCTVESNNPRNEFMTMVPVIKIPVSM